jgi:hypothetical protein
MYIRQSKKRQMRLLLHLHLPLNPVRYAAGTADCGGPWY